MSRAPGAPSSKYETARKRVLLALAYYEHRMHRGVADYARAANWILDASMAHYQAPPPFWRGEGVLALMLPDRPDLTRYLHRLDVPIVALTTDVKGVATARVVLDNFQIGRIAAEHLIERGFQHLAFYKCTHYQDARQRLAGFAAAVNAAGLDYTLLDGYEAAQQNPRGNPALWLQRKLLKLPKPLGVVAQSDHRAYFLLCVCEKAGIRVPEALAVVGIDNDEYTCEFAPVPITSVDSNREKLAYEAAALLDRLIDGQPPPAEPVRIPPAGLVVRRSSDILAIEHPEVAKAIGFIWKHFHLPIGVSDVVAATATSRCSLYRAFEQSIGRTIREEIERKRLERAKRLLLNSTDKVSSIARQCGYASGEQFCRAFARCLGVTPSVYRQQSELVQKGHP
jgi:LacI family transcriptional regulator